MKYLYVVVLKRTFISFFSRKIDIYDWYDNISLSFIAISFEGANNGCYNTVSISSPSQKILWHKETVHNFYYCIHFGRIICLFVQNEYRHIFIIVYILDK